MSSSAQDLPQLDLGNTYGALFIGVIVAAVLVNHSVRAHSKITVFYFTELQALWCEQCSSFHLLSDA
jgi:hypothetical protein